MTIPLAFESPSGATSSFAPGCASRGAKAAAMEVRARIRSELAGTGGDVLWRMTTKPWARARRSAVRPAPRSVRDVIEGAVTVATMLGMAFVSLACLVA